jgi:hypothetical protein
MFTLTAPMASGSRPPKSHFNAWRRWRHAENVEEAPGAGGRSSRAKKAFRQSSHSRVAPPVTTVTAAPASRSIRLPGTGGQEASLSRKLTESADRWNTLSARQ